MSELLVPGTPWHNWGRCAADHPAWTATPTSTDEVAALVTAARERGLTVKPVGSGHSFTAIAATAGIRLDPAGLRGLRAVDPVRGRVTLGAGTRLWELPAILDPLGLALENMGDIDRQTIAGATSTGTHGTGAGFRGLAAQVTAVTLVTGTGETLRVSEDEHAELLPAVRLGLGALGVAVEVEVQCVPAFVLRAVEHPEPFDEVLDGFEQRAKSADHFEFYWWPHTATVMTKANTRLPADAPRLPIGAVTGWVEERLLQNGALAAMCAVTRAVPRAVPSLNRLATRVYGDREYTDRSHAVFTSRRDVRFREMEYAIPVDAVPQALRDVRDLVDRSGWRISFPVEVRVAAADDNWSSTAYGRDSGYIAVHRHFRDDHEPYFQAVESVMRGYEGRPHWGKLHHRTAEDLAPVYPRFADFQAVRDRLDPGRVFANPYLDRVLGP